MNEKELRQLQTALKNTEGVLRARKTPRELGLIVDFRGHEFRINYFESHAEWRVTRGLGEFPGGSELATLVPIILKCQQDKEAEAIAEVEAAKTKAEEKRQAAIAQAAAEKKKTEELRDYCRLTVVPGFDRQSWCENHFGFGKWNIAELNRHELEILETEIKRRVEDAQKAAAVPALYDAIAEGESVAEEIQIWQKEKAIADEKEAIEPINAQELAEELTQIFSGDPNFYIRNVWETSLIVCCDAGFLVQIRDRGEGDWFCEDLTATAAEGWSLRFNICKIALSQACQSIISRKQQGREFLTLKGKMLTLKQPWAWAVFALGKNIENRSWATTYQGRLFIHAGQSYDHSGAAWINQKFRVKVPGPEDLPKGAIVGWVEMKGVTRINKLDEAPWAIAGHFHWVLKKPQSCEPIPWKGQQGLFNTEIPFPTPPQWLLDNAQEFWARNTEIPNGSPYCPSNGSEGDWFCGGWCEQCSKLNSCPLPIRSMAGEQPSEWIYWDQKPICLGWDEAIAEKPLAYYPYQGLYKVGDAEGNLEEFESAEEAIVFINEFPQTGKSLTTYQIAEEVACE